MPTIISATEYLSFDAVGTTIPAVPLDTPAWRVIDYSPLYMVPPRLGADRHIPGSAGRLAVAREYDELQVSLAMNVYGNQDQTGAVATSRPIGLRTNMDYLRTNVVQPLAARAVTFHKQAGGTVTGTVYVDDWVAAAADGSGALARAVLRLIIPSGFLT